MMVMDPLSRLQGRVLRDAVPQCGAESRCKKPASAAVGSPCLQSRDHQDDGRVAAFGALTLCVSSIPAKGAAMGR